MLKRTIEFEDFDGNPQTGTYYFNLTKAELVELEASYNGGLEEVIKQVIATKDMKKLIELFKRVIMDAYGEKTDDGTGFIKSESLRQQFAATPAYSELFMELATDAEAAAVFIQGCLPKSLAGQVKAELDQDKPLAPPPAPPAPTAGA